LELNLIDKIGHLDDAVQLAKAAGGGGDFKVIQYQRPRSLQELVLGVKTRQPGSVLDPAALRKGMMPRMWYLAPGSEAAGMLSAMEAE
jgi:ClpP class serine protease